MPQKSTNGRPYRPDTDDAPAWQDTGREYFEKLLDGIYRQRWIVMATLAVTIGVVTIYNLSKEPEYDASSVILLDLQSRWDRMRGTAPAAVDVFAENDRSLAGELYVIQASGRIAERVRERVGAVIGAAPSRATKVRFVPAEEQIDAIQVVATSGDPKTAALLANLYAEEYVRLTREASRANATASRELLEQQEKKYQEDLRQVEAEIQSYLQRNGAAGLDATASHLVTQLGALEAQRDNARIELQQRQASLETLQEEIKKINPSIVRRLSSGADETIRAYQAQIAKLEMDRDAIKMTYRDNMSPEVSARIERIETQLSQLRGEVRSRSEEYVGDMLADGGLGAGQNGVSAIGTLSQQALGDRIAIEGLTARLDVVNARLNEYEGRLGGIPARSMDLARLQRRKEHAEQMYSLVMSRLQQMVVEEESQPGYARVLRDAGVPSVPARPNRFRNMLLGSIFGLLLGCGLAATRERLDNRIYKPEDLLDRGMTLLGVIPDMKPLLKEDHNGADHVEWNGKMLASNLVMLHSPTSAVAESYRQARTNVLFGRNGHPVRSLVVTGAAMTDGKTATVSNLAISLAQAGNRTLLIDADLRRPDLHNRFSITAAPGLVDVLAAPPGAEIPVVETDVENLLVLPSGVTHGSTVCDNPAEMLGSKSMKDLLRRLKKDYDVVIVDTPPILAATDAVVLSTQCDATLMVVRAGKTRESEMNYAMKVLGDVHAQVIGAILNGFSLSMAYGYTYRYPGYTRYGMYSKYGYYGANGKEKKPTAWARLGIDRIKQTIERGKQHVA